MLTLVVKNRCSLGDAWSKFPCWEAQSSFSVQGWTTGDRRRNDLATMAHMALGESFQVITQHSGSLMSYDAEALVAYIGCPVPALECLRNSPGA